MNKCFLYFPIFCFTLFSCYRVPEKIEPKISYAVQDTYIKSLPYAFNPLSLEEKKTNWGTEYLVGLSFAKQLDLYRAITAFKRAEILISPALSERKLEIQYNMILCYYLAQKYEDIIEMFTNTELIHIDSSFIAYKDLLIIMYESYKETKDLAKANLMLKLIENDYPDSAKKLTLSTALQKGNIEDLKEIAKDTPSDKTVGTFIDTYNSEKKSVKKAQRLNMLPGAGYLYVGQKQSAITAFLFNGLFIAASVFFFKEGNIPAGVVTTSFEMGWYFGGIYGAGEAAKLYNENIYEANAHILLNRQKLAPTMMLNYAF